METFEIIKFYREKLGLSQSSLAEMVGYKDRSSIAKIESGLVDLPQSKIALFAKAFKITPAQLMGITNDPTINVPKNLLPLPDTYQVPLIGSIACGQPIPALEDAEETVGVPDEVRADFALRCKGDSMITARIFDGDIVYIRKQPAVETGQIAAVRIDDEATLKRVYYNQQDGRLVLRACNPLFPDLVYEGERLNDIEVLGLAVGFYSAVRHE